MTIVDPVWDKLVKILSCLEEAITEEGLTPLCSLAVTPGAAPADDFVMNDSCLDAGKDGQAWIKIVTSFPTTAFPRPAQASNCNDSYLAVTCELGIIRTSPYDFENGEPAATEAVMASASNCITEMLLMQKVLLCCYDLSDILLLNYTPIGPLGYAVGGAWTFTLSTDDAD